jgi:hypothetical protein
MAVFVKDGVRGALVVTCLFIAQFGYGLSFEGLAGTPGSQLTQLPESASLAALGLAMLLFANGARRSPSAPSTAKTSASRLSQAKPLVPEPQRQVA